MKDSHTRVWKWNVSNKEQRLHVYESIYKVLPCSRLGVVNMLIESDIIRRCGFAGVGVAIWVQVCHCGNRHLCHIHVQAIANNSVYFLLSAIQNEGLFFNLWLLCFFKDFVFFLNLFVSFYNYLCSFSSPSQAYIQF